MISKSYDWFKRYGNVNVWIPNRWICLVVEFHRKGSGDISTTSFFTICFGVRHMGFKHAKCINE